MNKEMDMDATRTAPEESERATILVVDDVPANIEVISGILRPHYRVRAATSGVRALSIAMGETPPDLILLDIMMPGMDGYEVCEKLKADLRTQHVPIIFVTAMSEIEDEETGFDVGCVDYLTKPVRPAIVLARVKTQLALANQQVELERLVKIRTVELEETRLAVIRCLGRAAEFKDDNTGLHVIRMSKYARLLGLAVGMSERVADLLMLAAPMHDVGKIGVPDSILKKPGPLTPDELVIMRRHVVFGAQILGDQNSDLLKMARLIALTHHEKWDGSGYPNALQGEQIPLVGRITALADVFDALCSVRPYKKSWTREETLDFIGRERGKHFDPMLVDKLPSVLDEFEQISAHYADG